MAMFGAVSFIIPITIVVIIIAIVVGVARADKQGGEEDVIKSIYIYLVLFATLMMTIGGSVAAFMAVADIVTPTPYYQSYEDYKNYGIDKRSFEGQESPENVLTEEEIRERYEAMVQTEKDRQVARAKNNLIKSFGWIVIPFPIFIYFQRKLVHKTL